jgi:tetratricopeptide (TPR) repeat protein
MKNLLAILFLCFAFALPSTACLNYYYTLDEEGHLHFAGEDEDLLKPFHKNFKQEFIVSKMEKLETKMKKDHSYMLLSDYAVCLMKLGKTKEALEILVELSANYPNEYKIASNLGTAYELNGEVDSALKYIRRGLQLNPNDHAGSEWVHVKILETKKKLVADSTWLKTRTVLGLSEKQKQDSVVQKQILIQLQERFPFSPGPDAIMASLFVDLGDISANRNSIEYAKVFYQIAKEYYGDRSKALADKVKEMQKLSDKYAAIRPERKRYTEKERIEGENVKLGTISYKTLLLDNNDTKYKVDWNKVTYDPKALLALVNLKMSVKEAREQALKNQSGDLKLVSDSAEVKAPVPAKQSVTGKVIEKSESNTWLVIGLSLFTLGLVAFIAYRSSRKGGKNNNE